MLSLLYGGYLITLLSQRSDCLCRSREILPDDRLRSSESGLMYVPVRWSTRDAAEIDGLYEKGICRAKYRTYIEMRAHIIQHDDDGCFTIDPKLLRAEAVEFRVLEFAHEGGLRR
jgi:hypothetical protein